MHLRRSLTAALAALLCTSIAFAFAQTPTPQPAPAVPRPAIPVPRAPGDAPTSFQPVPPPPTIPGKAWILLDYTSGQVIAGENMDMRLPPASLTKVMTGYVVGAEMKNGKVHPDDDVFISERAWKEGGAGTDGSFSALVLNSKVKLIDVLHGLIIQSGNDAAIALAEHVAGSEEAFVALMNQYAARLGMTNSHFMNSHGLTTPGHYMSARDIATLSRALIHDFPQEYAIYKIKEFTYNGIRQYNRNELLERDASVDGIKTGHTDAAGYCLAASAVRGDQRLISVVLGIDAKSSKEGFRAREDSNLSLLNWGFRFFETHTLFNANTRIAQVKVWKGQADSIALGTVVPVQVVIPRGSYGKLKPVMDVPKQLVAPIARGQRIGTLRVMLNGVVLQQRPLVALAEIKQAGFFGRIWDDFMMWWKS
jgi:D-alanyl-D-alanine carboxypeptidase (penicillin-binding protein 5/6)